MATKSPTAVALRHVAFEDLGLLATQLDARGFAYSYREAPIDDLADPTIERADLLIVLGGPVGAYETADHPFLTEEIALVARRLAAHRPTLGICLGAQLMAAALGARVYPGGIKAIGWGPVTPTAEGLASALAPLAEPTAEVLHWHGDTFDLPDGAVRLAADRDYPNQAFAHGPAALALQFHLEVDPDRLGAWFVGHTVELAAAGVSIPALRAASLARSATARARAARIFGDWLDGLALTDRPAATRR
jgi:GMP synthase (glutamine-hydrolysing)